MRKIEIRKELRLLSVILLIFNPLLLTTNIFESDSNPKYIGFKDNEQYAYKTEFNKNPLQKFFEDFGLTEEESDLASDVFFEINDLSENTKYWVITPKQISSEKERRINGIKTDYVSFRYKLEKNHKDFKDKTGLKTIENNIRIDVYEYKAKLYRDWLIELLFFGEMYNLYEARSFFIANNVNWKSLLKEVKDELDADFWDVSLETVNINKVVGFSVQYFDEDNDELGNLKDMFRYDNGILYLKELSYNGKMICRFELDNYPTFLKENWIVLSIILIALISLLFVVILLKRK